MILYFSGTGNSKYVAENIARKIEDEVVSINKLMKLGNEESFKNEKPLVIVAPIYAWRIPKVVEEFIRKSNFLGNKKAYFVVTCESQVGSAEKYIIDLCNEKTLEFRGLGYVYMPDNYIVMYPSPKEEDIKVKLNNSQAFINTISNYINKGEVLPKVKGNIIDRVRSSVINNLFYKFFVNAKGFHATDKCIGCNKCANLCSLNNITLIDGQPKWGENCTHCMACICGCPKEAIEYKKNTIGKSRYWLTEK